MALITCPECGQPVSNEATQCIHCGYPLQKQTSAILRIDAARTAEQAVGIVTVLSDMLNIPKMQIPKMVDQPSGIIELTLDYTVCQAVQQRLDERHIVASVLDRESRVVQPTLDPAPSAATKNTVTCPRCGSTQITTGQRGWKLTTGFLGSSKTVNRCANCGYKWEPSFWTRNR